MGQTSAAIGSHWQLGISAGSQAQASGGGGMQSERSMQVEAAMLGPQAQSQSQSQSQHTPGTVTARTGDAASLGVPPNQPSTGAGSAHQTGTELHPEESTPGQGSALPEVREVKVNLKHQRQLAHGLQVAISS